MRKILTAAIAITTFLMISTTVSLAAAAGAGGLTCVGLYSETSDGSVSYHVGTGNWVVMAVGDKIPANGEIKINVERDWVELIPTANPNAVYEIGGPSSGETIKKVADILKGKPRTVTFPKGTTSTPDTKFKNKLVVTQYLGRQIYTTADGDSNDIKYGAVLDIKGKVRIIAINNTINLEKASGGVTQVIGPLNFDVEKVLTNQQLYKFLNTH